MKTLKDVGKFSLKMMNVGTSGSGKTYLAGTFPKTYFLNTEPGGMDTIRLNPELRKNLVGWDEFIPENSQDTKRVFNELVLATRNAKELYKQGKVETLVLDNMTFLSENRMLYIETYEKEISARTGNVDTMSMYGKLGRWQYQFVLMCLLTFPGNVVMNVHEQLESDEALKKKPDNTCPILPNILGGFRNKAEGMFSCVFYLQKLVRDKQYRYFARTNKGNQRNAKNRLGLPEIIEGVSYSKIMEIIDKKMKEV